MQDHILLAKPENLDKADLSGKSALHYAVKHGHLDIVQLLLCAGVKLEEPRMRRLSSHRALRFSALLSCRSDSESPIHTAVKHGHLGIVRLLVAYGANVNSEWSEYSTTPLRQAIDLKQTAVADYLRSAGGLEKSFRSAASDGDINVVLSWLLTSPQVIKQEK